MTQTTLCFDFGNTRLKCAVFSGNTLQQVLVLENDQDATIQELIERFHPTQSILSSVIDHNPGIESILTATTAFHRLTHKSKIPVTTPVGKPQDIGADRLAMVVAATTLFPGKNNLVVGLGTAITYNFVNKYAQFMGGGISPGMELRLKSLHEHTAKLPLVKKDWNFPLLGYDTRTNILSGVILGMAKEIDGMIGLYVQKYHNLNVILTGGDTSHFAAHLQQPIVPDPDLLFKGLYAICQYNVT
ncbi:MAG: type III pantothenate kinase [Chitinophagaceae bacterium]